MPNEIQASYLELSYFQVGAATLLIIVNGVLSISLRLHLERSLLIAGVRTVLQLLLIGLVLEWVFAQERWYVVLGLLVLMTVVAGVTAVQRGTHRYPGIWWNTLVSVWMSSWLMTAFAVFVVLQGPHGWYEPQYVIPLLGMLLGNALNGVSLGLNTFLDRVTSHREQVDAQLALGATRWEAARGLVREALRVGMTPIINSMMIVGLVSLPGMMTGQLLSGTAPGQAVRYQIVIMFLIASVTAVGAAGAVLLSFRRVFSRDHQLLRRLVVSRSAK